jgi:hypothetical protein
MWTRSDGARSDEMFFASPTCREVRERVLSDIVKEIKPEARRSGSACSRISWGLRDCTRRAIRNEE